MCLILLLFIFNPDNITDIGYSSQFMINNNGLLNGIEGEDLNVVRAWKKGYTGQNIHINIVDSGCRISHVDFSSKAGSSYNYENQGSDPFTGYTSSIIGTSVLSMAAASVNEKASVGVAPDSTVSCTSFSMSKSRTFEELQAIIMKDYTKVDIKVLPFMVAQKDSRHLSDFNYQTIIADMATEGRNKNGTIVIIPAGNTGHLGGDANSYHFACSRFAITVGSSTNRGAPTYFTNYGSCISVSAPTSGLPDELSQLLAGFPQITVSSANDDELVEKMSGFSAVSAGSVAGVVALMLQANPGLGFRDVQAILQITATKTDPTSPLWVKNAANLSYHPRLGFGRVNADLAVEVAKKWVNFPGITLDTVVNKVSDPLLIPGCDNEPLMIGIAFPDEVAFIEYVEIEIETYMLRLDNARIYVVSPSGTRIPVLLPNLDTSKYEDHIVITTKSTDSVMIFGIRGFFGESAYGDWSVYIGLAYPNPNDAVSSISLSVYGIQTKPVFPEFEKQIAQPSEIMKSDIPLQSQISVDGPITCGKVFNLTRTGISPLNRDLIPIPLYIVDKKTNRSMSIGEITWLTNNTEIIPLTLPCTIPSSEEYNLSLKLDYHMMSVTTAISFINNEASKIIEPINNDKISVVKGSDTRIKVRWARKTPIRPLGYTQKVVVNLYDPTTNKVVVSKTDFDLGNTDLILPSSVSISKGILTIAPVYTHDYLFESETYASEITFIQTSPPPTSTPSSGGTPLPTGLPIPSSTSNQNQAKPKTMLYIGSASAFGLVIIIIVVLACRKPKFDESSYLIRETLVT